MVLQSLEPGIDVPEPVAPSTGRCGAWIPGWSHNGEDLTKSKGLCNIKYMVARHFQSDDLLFEPELNFHDFEIPKTQ